MHVRLADESVCIGPPSARDSYLNTAAVLSAAAVTGADAIHPGYGFLSENARFAEMVEAHGLTFIGPSSDHIRMMGDKISAKAAMASLGVPLGTQARPGRSADLDEARAVGERVGYPILVKAAAGGGGRGMKVAHSADELEEAWTVARTEAQAAFGNDAVYIEKYLDRPRHIELQVLADAHGNVVHFGERDCSLQRRHQKLLEEAGSPALSPAQRDELGAVVTAGLRQLGYRNAGTLEFLYQDGQFAFIEMNTRLQVEHPVSEMVCDVDLVREQIRVAAGQELGYTQADVQFRGHAIECRVTAEDPETFMPTPGRVDVFHAPGGLGVRVDSALYAGYVVPPYYDSMVAKLIVHAPTRPEAIARMRRALDEFVVQGIKTSLPLHRRIMEAPEFVAGDYTIHWLERFVGTPGTPDGLATARRRATFTGMSRRTIDVTPDLLLRAYRAGLFPMAETRHGSRLYWLDPELRGVLPLDGFHLPKRLLRTVLSDQYEVSSDRAFPAVVAGCAAAAPGRQDTWINADIERLFGALHRMGHAHSVECRRDGVLVGGLVRRVGRRRVLRGEHVQHGARRLQGGAGPPGRADADGRLHPARHPVRDQPPRPVRGRRDPAGPLQGAACRRRRGRRPGGCPPLTRRR